jgi:hypothetical protein
MRRIVLFGMSAFMVFLAVVQSSSSKLGTPARIQNRDTVEKLYGNPVSEIYRTSQNLTITASYASNGDLCRAHIESDVDDGITDKQLNAALDELAPKDVRGEYKLGTFLDVTCLKLLKPENSKSHSSGKPAMQMVEDPCAECSGVSEDYEQVNITKYGNTNQYSSVWVTFHGPECKGLDKVHH